MNKTVLITGGAKGIGREIALEFLKLKYNVCITYNNSIDKAIELENMGINIYKLDVLETTQVDNVISNIVSKFGKIDCLVNNAGICDYSLFNEIDSIKFNEIININLNSIHCITKSVLNKSMIDNKSGNIINISSIWGVVGASLEVAYSASKAGVIGLTKALAKELGLSRINVNSVSLGAINTDMLNKFSDEELSVLKDEIPLNRIGEVSDVSKVVVFLASEGAKYITGQNIIVDGGMSI